ncbi:MAG: pitrilysin family protein [Myxococcales bacterium]
MIDETRARWAQGDVHYDGPSAFGNDWIHRYRLGNGLKVLVLVDRSAPIATYHTWFSVGSRHERPGKTGLAHFFEHLMFGPTENHAAGEFDRRLEENGAESNAATWVDWTFYHESLPSDRLDLAIELEAERMAKLVLQEPQVANEREVVANERRQRVEDDIEGAANELLYKTAFTTHPYRWPTIGWMEDIQSYSPDDCAAFYRTYYAPNNACVVVVGDVDEPSLIAKIHAAYSSIASSIVPPEDTEPEPAQREDRDVSLTRPTATEKLLMAYHGPALGDVDHAVLTVLGEVLSGGRASRLHRRLVLQLEIATDVRVWTSTFSDPGLFEVYATARGEHTTAELLQVIDEELARVRSDVVTDDELARAKARLELSLLHSLDTVSGKAEQIGFYETVLGEPAAAFRRLDAYRRTTAAEIRKAARRHLTTRTIVRVLPDGTEEPS